MTETPRDPAHAVDDVARLAHLALGPARRAELAPQLERILDAFGVLEAADLDDEPAPTEAPATLRADEPRPSLGPERVLRAAPERVGDFFGVPKTVGEDA